MSSCQLSEEEFQFFLSNLALYQSNVDEGKILRSKNEDCCVGLLNAGSTCYLNSVIQCLFHLPDFIDAVKVGDMNNPILKELYRLFQFLSHSTRSAVPTTELLKAFGWANGQAHEQHDAHELFCLLLDSIEKSSEESGRLIKQSFEADEAGSVICSGFCDVVFLICI